MERSLHSERAVTDEKKQLIRSDTQSFRHPVIFTFTGLNYFRLSRYFYLILSTFVHPFNHSTSVDVKSVHIGANYCPLKNFHKSV